MDKLNKFSGRFNKKLKCPKCENSSFNITFIKKSFFTQEKMRRTCVQCLWSFNELPLDAKNY